MPTATKTSNTIRKPDNALKTKPSGNKKTYLEVMRIIAAFFVIVNHTSSDVFLTKSEPKSPTWYLTLIFFFLSKIAVPVFFMIMGGLLLQRVDPVKKSLQRIGRALAVTVIYSAVYYWYLHSELYYSQFNATPPEMSLKEFFKMIFTSRATNAFWYLYVYIGLLILLPILQRFAQGLSKGSTLYLVILSVGVTGLIPLIRIFHQIEPHHYLTDAFIAPPIGALFLGLFIEKYLKSDIRIFVGALGGFIISFTFTITKTLEFFEKTPTSYLYLEHWSYLNIVGCALCFYIIVKYLSDYVNYGKTVSKIVCYIGSLTFGIYLLSDLVMIMTRPFYQDMQGDMKLLTATLLWQLIIFAICGVVTAVLKFIPGFKKLI